MSEYEKRIVVLEPTEHAHKAGRAQPPLTDEQQRGVVAALKARFGRYWPLVSRLAMQCTQPEWHKLLMSQYSATVVEECCESGELLQPEHWGIMVEISANEGLKMGFKYRGDNRKILRELEDRYGPAEIEEVGIRTGNGEVH